MAEEKEKEADQSAEKQDPEKSMPPNEAQPNNAADEAKKAEDGGGAAAAAADGAAAGGGDDSKVPLNEDDAAKVPFYQKKGFSPYAIVAKSMGFGCGFTLGFHTWGPSCGAEFSSFHL